MDKSKDLIINIPFTKEMVESSHKKAKALGKINNSILGGLGNFAGYLGEEAVAHFIGAEIVSNDEGTDKYNYDIVKDGRRIEVKTKRRTVAPRDYYDVSVAKTSAHQQPDLYIFTSIQFQGATPRAVWVLGQKRRDEYFKEATLWKKGDVDKRNNFKTHQDMYNLQVKDLEPLDDSLLPQKQ